MLSTSSLLFSQSPCCHRKTNSCCRLKIGNNHSNTHAQIHHWNLPLSLWLFLYLSLRHSYTGLYSVGHFAIIWSPLIQINSTSIGFCFGKFDKPKSALFEWIKFLSYSHSICFGLCSTIDCCISLSHTWDLCVRLFAFAFAFVCVSFAQQLIVNYN